MNASEQAKGLELATKIASVVSLFKLAFPDARADLKPWHNDPDTREWIDPHSIDIVFHLPGWSRRFGCRSILVQIRFHQDVETQQERLIGVEMVAFNHTGQAWRMSTIDHWQLVGSYQPAADVVDKLKQFCRQVFELFNA